MQLDALKETLHQLLAEQRLAVLSTDSDGQPFGSLMAIAAEPDLKSLLFATRRDTRKYRDLQSNNRASLMIDNRSNDTTDFHRAIAVTVTGRVSQVPTEERKRFFRQFLGKHPSLEPFVRSEDCAHMELLVDTYYLVQRFEDATEWHVDQ